MKYKRIIKTTQSKKLRPNYFMIDYSKYINNLFRDITKQYF